MCAGCLRLSVMRYSASQVPSRDPRPKHSLRDTAVGTVAAAVLVPAVALAVLYPVVGAGVAALALAARLALRAVRGHVRERRRRKRARQVCVPKTDVCVDV